MCPINSQKTLHPSVAHTGYSFHFQKIAKNLKLQIFLFAYFFF